MRSPMNPSDSGRQSNHGFSQSEGFCPGLTSLARHVQSQMSGADDAVFSALFLISYVTAHYFIPDTMYGDINHNHLLDIDESATVSSICPIYLTILLSHIFLAVIVLPLILLSFYYGLKDDRIKHKKITRFSYPIWLYVTVSGVVVYIMISPYYNY